MDCDLEIYNDREFGQRQWREMNGKKCSSATYSDNYLFIIRSIILSTKKEISINSLKAAQENKETCIMQSIAGYGRKLQFLNKD